MIKCKTIAILFCVAGSFLVVCMPQQVGLVGSGARCVLQSIRIISNDKSNSDAPTAVDIVVVKNPVLAEMLMGKDAFQWFREKKTIQNKYSKEVTVYSAELVPLSDTIVYLPYFRSMHRAIVLLYARYFDPAGRSCANITKYRNIDVVLSEDSYVIHEQGYWRMY